MLMPSFRIDVVSGSLPPGVRFAQPVFQVGSFQVPLLIGIPTAEGNFSVNFTVTDYLGGVEKITYTVSVVQKSTDLDLSRLPLIGEVGVTYLGEIKKIGGGRTMQWCSSNSASNQLNVGSTSVLFFGLNVSSDVGRSSMILSGDPNLDGIFSLQISCCPFFYANNETGIITGNCVSNITRITIYPRLVLPVLPRSRAVQGSFFTCSFKATGGIPDSVFYTISSGSLPPGLSLDAKSGNLSGILGESSELSFAFTVTAMAGSNARSSTNVVIDSTPSPVSLSSAAIAGIVIGILAAIAVFTILSIFGFRKWNASKANINQDDDHGYHQLIEGKSYKY